MHPVCRYSDEMETATAHRDAWLRVVARALRKRWPSVDQVELDDQAVQLWQDERLRGLEAHQAAAEWLKPLREDKR